MNRRGFLLGLLTTTAAVKVPTLALPEAGGIKAYDQFVHIFGPVSHDPVIIAFIRNTGPMRRVYDVCGAQNMTGPTDISFAMRSRYGS